MNGHRFEPTQCFVVSLSKMLLFPTEMPFNSVNTYKLWCCPDMSENLLTGLLNK